MEGHKKNRQRFWMCFVDGEACPRYRHYSGQDAMKEAERLAKLTNKDVFLLEATDFVRYTPPTPPPTIEWKDTIV